MSKIFEIIDSLSIKQKAIIADAGSLLNDMRDSGKTPTLSIQIDATHSGRLTNGRVYPGRHMKKSARGFLEPYPKPVLRHHNDEEDAIGRVTGARFMQLKTGDDFDHDYRSPSKGLGSGFIKISADITAEDAIKKIIDGRYQQVSTRQGFSQLNCSICGSDYASTESCEHYPGRSYSIGSGSDKKEQEYLCYGITGPLSYREVSFVNIPGDDHAKVTDFEKIHADSETPFVIHCDDKEMWASVDSLVLSDGSEVVDLTATRGKRRVSSGDRKKLTGKSIIAVSPNFNIYGEGDNMNTLKEDLLEVPTEVATDEPNTSSDHEIQTKENTPNEAASLDGSEETLEETSEEIQEEGVEAPTEETQEESTESDSEAPLSDEAFKASIEALTKSLKDAAVERDNLSAELDRAKSAISDKEDENGRIRASHNDTIAELKEAYATTLLNSRIFLKKNDVAHVKDEESFAKQIEKYVVRSIDSLKDSISDLTSELSEHNSKKVLKPFAASKVAEERVQSPVSNKPANKDSSIRSSTVTKKSALENLFG